MLTHTRTFRHAVPNRPRLWARLSASLALRRTRRSLGGLSQDALRDIGVSRTDANREAARPLWDAPESWFR